MGRFLWMLDTDTRWMGRIFGCCYGEYLSAIRGSPLPPFPPSPVGHLALCKVDTLCQFHEIWGVGILIYFLPWTLEMYFTIEVFEA